VVARTTRAIHINDRLKTAGICGDGISVLLPATAVTEARGGAFEWLAGIDASGIPEIGPFIAAGPLLVVLSNVETAAKSSRITGALIALGLPEFTARIFEDKLRTGSILMSVHAEDSEEIIHAEKIFTEAQAHDICTVGDVSVTENPTGRELAPFEIASAAVQS